MFSHLTAKRAGIPPGSVSNHVLRRSGARMMIYAGAGIVDVSTMLGHADTRTTMLYIGLTLDDLTKVQEKRDDYLDIIRMKMKATPERTAERITLFAR
ncbi:MAG: tyrosine-type recombinase/integrase [Methanomassiliicoccaceae archaeon]|jgi:site-specific recombinase XerD|nr:tyrosine-type recombinase/integrase [Euryarchaeota archaeon]HOB37615.1 tyrosine-type recombinase/integrase [Methanomassiliicoccaceae archaeon]HOL06969.1 tyrosine-type recombinase/integrase [Methanomassiliicoccaceae archaeon]HOQ26977.1 tyrosine-type recombinase/integrase [Methanomassiliicoccaceae archaeon]